MEKYTIKTGEFEGPLDLLCYLVDKNKMDICDIRIAEITDQYLEYLNKMQEMNLDVTSEFIVMASKLIYLKSKSLLPSLVVDEEEEDEFDLVKLLVEYKRYKEFTISLKDRGETYGKRFFKMPSKIEFPKEKITREYETNVIPSIYEAFVTKEKDKKNMDAENVNRIAMSEKVTIISKVREILKELFTKPSFIFNKLFNVKTKPKIEVVTAFLSLLELSRKNRVQVTQSELFGDICVEKIKKTK